jgi:uncharacterized iron-regulated membrane protein
MTTMRLRGWWFSVHKWIGLCLAILIVPVSLTGSALVWHDWLDETLNPQRYAVSGEAGLAPSAYAAAARPALGPEERVASIRWPEGEGPVTVVAARPPQPGATRPARTNVWLDPASGRLLDSASADAGLVRVMHVLHGSLMVPGWGRTIVGWVGVFMFVSCLTGIWLWWPITGSVKRGFRWKRQNSTNANIHHLLGFWILVPLAMLSFTGFWISFPSVFSSFEASQPRAKGKDKGGPPGGDRARAMRARPLEQTALTADQALAAAQPHATGRLVTVTWPTDQAGGMEDRLRARGRPGRGRGRGRLGRGHAAAPAPAREPRPADAPAARRHRHGPFLADRDLHRRDHPCGPVGDWNRDVAEEPRLALAAGEEAQGREADAAAGGIGAPSPG